MNDPTGWESQLAIWEYYKPRQTHTWNMLFLANRALGQYREDGDDGFEVEYLWENFIIRLWLYRATVLALAKMPAIKAKADALIRDFDSHFQIDGFNGLKAVRDMIEHFDDYAAAKGRGPATRESELDPWREISRDRFERGRFVIQRASAYDAVVQLRSGAKRVGDEFIAQYNTDQITPAPPV